MRALANSGSMIWAQSSRPCRRTTNPKDQLLVCEAVLTASASPFRKKLTSIDASPARLGTEMVAT
jgi:hypothetical protein